MVDLNASDKVTSSPRPWFMSVGMLGASDLLARSAGWLGFVYLMHLVDPGVYGLLGMASSVVSILLPFVDLGLGVIATREAALPSANAEGLLRIVTLRRGILAIGVFLVVVISSRFVSPPLLGRLLLGSSLFVFVGALTPDWLLQARERFGSIAFGRIIQSGVYLAMLLFLVRAPADIVIQPVVAAFSFGVGICAVLPATASILRTSHGREDAPVRVSSRSSWDAFVGTIALQNVLPLSILGVGVFSNSSEAGWLNAASRFWIVGTSVAILPATVYFPRLVAARNNGVDVVNVFRQAMISTGLVSGLLVMSGILWSVPLLELLAPEDFRESAISLAILCVGLGFQTTTVSFARMLIAFNEERKLRRGLLTGALLGASSIPVLSGIYGSLGGALSCTIAEGVALAGTWFVVASQFPRARGAVLNGFSRGFSPVAVLAVVIVTARQAIGVHWHIEMITTLCAVSGIVVYHRFWSEMQ